MDTADGEKIVSHVFGGQQDQVASQLAGTANLGGAGGDLVRRLLPILAPIIMSYLAKKILGGQQGGGQASQLPGGTGAGGAGGGAAGGAGGIDLGSILGGILGGAAGAGAAPEGRAREASGTFLAASWAAASRRVAQPRDALVPEPMNDSTSQQPAEPLGQPTRQSGAPVPGELIEVDLPEALTRSRRTAGRTTAAMAACWAGSSGRNSHVPHRRAHRIRFSTNAAFAGRHSSRK